MTVEVDLSVGIGIHLVGLPDSAVRESLLRVITALTSYGFRIPGRKIVVNLAPADIRKEGSAYDLAIALGMLAASEQVSLVDCDKFLIMGELALDGRLRAVNGVLPAALKARDEGFGGCIFPAESAWRRLKWTGWRYMAFPRWPKPSKYLPGVNSAITCGSGGRCPRLHSGLPAMISGRSGDSRWPSEAWKSRLRAHTTSFWLVHQAAARA